MNVEAYLKRINYFGPVVPTAETLRDLQVAHLRSVPFENLSIHSGQQVVLSDEALFQKIVENKRGGFCYEVNGLFAALLRALGFKVAMLAAGVAKAPRSSAAGPVTDLTEADFGPNFDHMTLMVTLSQRWLVDVGFGDSFGEPLLLDETKEQVQGTESFRIEPADGHLILFRRKENEDWTAQYRFDLQPHEFPDYEAMCRYHQTSPDSHFTKSRICSRATLDGRITLSDLRLIATAGEERTETTLAGQKEYERVLAEEFGIVIY